MIVECFFIVNIGNDKNLVLSVYFHITAALSSITVVLETNIPRVLSEKTAFKTSD